MKRLAIIVAALAMAANAAANTCSIRTAGGTDQTVYVTFLDATTGVPTAGLLFNSSGIDLEYVRTGAAAVDITEATQTAAGAHSDGGFVSVGHGRYRLDLPDAAVAAGVPEVVIQGIITGYIMAPCAVALTPSVNTVALGGTAQTGRDIGASVLLSSGTGTGQLSITSGVVASDPATGTIDAAAIANNALDAATFAADVDAEILSYIVDDATRIDASELNGDIDSLTFTVAGDVDANMQGISGDTNVADRFEAILDGTCGSYPELGITRGVGCTAVSYTHATGVLVLDASAAFGDNTLVGQTALVCGSTQGYCQSMTIASNTLSGDAVTLDDPLPVEATGTVTFTLFGTAASTGGGGGGGDATEAKQDLIIANLAIVDTNVDDIESAQATFLADAGSNGAGFTNLPWNGAWDTEVQSEAADALNADTGDSFNAIPWNPAWDTEAQSEAADALNAYDPPTRAEATSDANSILTAVGDVPTNAELATSQAAADDATLAAVATVQASVDDLPTNAELATSQAAADDATLTAIAGVPAAVGTRQIPDSYASDGAQPTIEQALLTVLQVLTEAVMSGNQILIKKPDGTTTAITLTLSPSAENPESRTRSQ